MTTPGTKASRPLSPHLWIYRWPITMTMSIVHRVTGVGLYFGTAILAWWLFAAALPDPGHFAFVNGLLGSWIGLALLFGYTWALTHHMLGGVRHLVWDTGRLLGSPARNYIAYATIGGSLFLTGLVWIIGFAVRP